MSFVGLARKKYKEGIGKYKGRFVALVSEDLTVTHDGGPMLVSNER